MELKVVSVAHIDSHQVNANGDTIDRDYYTLKAVGKEGLPVISIKSEALIKGVKEKSVIEVEIKNSQKSLDEFDKKDE